MGDLEFLGQLVDSMSEAVDKLEKARDSGNKKEARKIEEFILDMQKKFNEELE